MGEGVISFAEPEPVRPTSHWAQCLLHLLERVPLKGTFPPLTSHLSLCSLGGRDHPNCCALCLCKESWGSSCPNRLPFLAAPALQEGVLPSAGFTRAALLAQVTMDRLSLHRTAR